MFFAAGVAVATQVDRHPSRWFGRHGPAQLSHLEPLGRYQVPNVLGLGLFSWGLVTGNGRWGSLGVSLVEANLVTSFSVSALQQATGRARPGEPWAGSFGRGGSSFPSAHAARAFAVAGVAWAFFPEFKQRWVFPLLASGVALSRVKERKHFFADVIMGAGLGWWVGHRLGASALRHGRWEVSVTAAGLRLRGP
ncbi:MAG: phosphatase PAP2 family protein [Thermoanaerobaculum sp.]|nr:phosphatase PAP2 family protein [Thermoanaerobaculum sp.]